MNYDPPLAYRVHRIALVVLFTLVALLFGAGLVLVAEHVWQQIVEMTEGTRAQWSST